MTDHYRIKELGPKEVKRGWMEAVTPFGIYCFAESEQESGVWSALFNGDFIFADGDYKDSVAAANDHHRKEVEKMLSPVESGWISVEESLPEAGLSVLTSHKFEDGLRSEMVNEHDGSYWDSMNTSATHWQPLPPAPGGEI